MAKKSIIRAAPKKKTAIRTPRIMDEKYTGPEPIWTGCENWTDEKIHREWQRGLYYYNYHYVVGDLIKYVRQYGTQMLKWSKDDVAAFNEVEDWRTGITAAAICKMVLNGAPLREASNDFLTKRINEILEMGRQRQSQKVPESKIVKLSIQDRMREKFSEVICEIESWYDLAREGKTLPDMVSWMRSYAMPQVFVNQIADYFTPQMEELEEAIKLRKKKNPTDMESQLVEGYAHITKESYARRADFYEKLTSALETYGAVKKAVRKARAKKTPSKEKLVKKIKYCTQDTKLNIVSVNPVEILGANTLWIYNTKTRKLGKYVAADDAGQLGIKGSSLVGFDEKKSIAKTLRKPPEQLKQFASSGKVALRSFIEDIKAVSVQLNGRLNADTVLLKAIK